MRYIIRIFLLTTVLMQGFMLFAQELKPNEIVVIKGEKYILHQVRTGETVYSITKAYKVDRSTLRKLNPEIRQGLKIGDILQIPYVEGIESDYEVKVQKGDPTRFIEHTIKSRKETAYFLAGMYGVTVEEIYAYNPTIRKYKRGTTVRIPVWEPIVEERKTEEIGETGEEEFFTHEVKSGETLYSISHLYGISEAEILNLNPAADDLRAGAQLRIPKKFALESDLVRVVEEEVSAETEEIMFFEHIIESGETLWGTARKYKVSEEELKEINPVLATGFQAGLVIKVPVSEPIKPGQATPVNEEEFFQHLVQKGETLWGLASSYDLTIPEIKKYNPVLETRNLLEGEVVLIPKIIEIIVEEGEAEGDDQMVYTEPTIVKEKPVVLVPEECQTGMSSYMDEEFKIALFLPLFLEANDTLNREYLDALDTLSADNTGLDENSISILEQDTSIERESIEMFKQFYGGSENYIQFYEGVLLAMDSMQKAGMKLALKVYDTQRNLDSVSQFINEEGFLSTDLIIGPVVPSVQKEVAEIAAKNRIPFVSPLASQTPITERNSKYYQVVPSREYIGKKTAEMVAEEYFESNFIVLKMGEYDNTPEGEIVASIQEKLFNSGFLSQRNGVSFTTYDFRKEGPFGLRRIMSHSKENVVYIPSMNEGELSVGVSNINNLADDFSITLIGSNRYMRYESINIEQYHNLKMRYVAPYWMDYSKPGSIEFIEKFKHYFGTEPDNYGIQGYDVAMYFLNALKKFGKDFEDCLPYLQMDLLQGNYHFEKVSQFGGYMNTGVSVISYGRNYEAGEIRVEGTPNYIVESEQ